MARSLGDLYRRGTPLTVDDGDGAVTVYLMKLNPDEQDKAFRKANAARARFMMNVKDQDSDDYLAAIDSLLAFSESELLDYAVSDLLVVKLGPLEAEIAAEEEWSKDGYLQGLRDSWDEGLADEYAREEERTPESEKVFEELGRFSTKVAKRIEQEREYLLRETQGKPVEVLQDQVARSLLKMQGDVLWMTEFRKNEMFFGTRKEHDHKVQYFSNRSEVDALEAEIQVKLRAAFEALSMDVIEGKDSPVQEASSAQSESLPEPEEASSGQAA